MGDDDGSVKVAVRVRPFNAREISMNATMIIKMNGPTTIIVDPETQKEKSFTFDYSYWSHDGFEEDENGVTVAKPGNNKYASQRRVFEDVGAGILRDAFNGYNCSLFAYGQTGSGKSYSMVGYGNNKGIIPIVCSELFLACERSDKPANTEYQVTCSMLEIYNEAVRDLLNPKVNKPGGLKVRSKPGVGVYVEDLTPVPVKSYAEIENAMADGTKNRTVAATQMNATSSRAHTVFTILFTTISLDGNGQRQEVTSKINLVDLAGSERADSTGATGDRLKEGSAINQSLSALGNVISALADQAMGKKKVFVPYRNSVLTRLLQDALGGNSKTIMIAALSPADVNYDETLSTLRYADRAKKIKNSVSKNENPTDRMIRELKEENARLLKMLSDQGVDVGAAMAAADASGGGDGGDGGGAVNAEAEAALRRQLQQQMEENQKLLEDMQRSWEEKLAAAQAIASARAAEDGSGAMSAQAARASALPSLINLHEDAQMSECVVYVFRHGLTRIGRPDAPEAQDIKLQGLNIRPQHAVVEHDEASGTVTVTPVDRSKTFVNGELIRGRTELREGDRVILGNNFVFRFHHPGHEQTGDGQHAQWQSAMDEFATKQGLRLQQDLSGSVKDLEAEEAQRRQELEAKLRELEATMAAERERARQALLDQRRAFEAGGAGALSETDRARLEQVEREYLHQAEGAEQELRAKREAAARLLEGQQRRRRNNKKLQQQLDALLPQVHEANQLASELGRKVRFEAHLQVQSPKAVALSEDDESRHLKQIKAMVRVTDAADGSEWNWEAEKFFDRLFLIRELYQEFLSYGPREVPQQQDPMWDPPEPAEIGRCFVYLKALSQLVEIESTFQVVDHRGEPQGQLSVEVMPELPSGEEPDYLRSSDELLGMSVNFVIRVPRAAGLPARFANDVYVRWNFMDLAFETFAHEGKSQNPEWQGYEHRLCLENIDDRLRQYLLTEAIVFEVKGFTDAQSRAAQPDAHAMLAAAAAAAAAGVPMEGAGGGAGEGSAVPSVVCDQCEERQAGWHCAECDRCYCDNCDGLLHKSKKKQGHERRTMAQAFGGGGGGGGVEGDAYGKADGGAAPGGARPRCEQCEEQPASLRCHDCGRIFCESCNALLHKAKAKQAHAREPLDGALAGEMPSGWAGTATA